MTERRGGKLRKEAKGRDESERNIDMGVARQSCKRQKIWKKKGGKRIKEG